MNAIDSSAVAGATVQVSNHRAVTTDAAGLFSVEVGPQNAYGTTVRGRSIVERQTTLYGPTGERARLSLIPADFDLAAFDEMARTANKRLQRWTSPPSLVVLGSVMVFRNTTGSEYEARGEQLSDDEISEMVRHFTEGLALLTANTFTGFASVEIERPAAGTRVNVAREGRIVAGRYVDIVTFAKTIGYGQWAEQPDGTVTGGSIFLDRDFDRSDSRRRLLRIHELGHALGYLHVRSRQSIMNPAIGPEPSDFDRAAAMIAFQRPPGNRSPDIDPGPASSAFSTASGGGRWMPPVFCN